MPRLDNTDFDVRHIFGRDPYAIVDLGTEPPIDICAACWSADFDPPQMGIDMEIDHFDQVEHPPYEEDPDFYVCAWCNEPLTQEDN